VAGERDKVMIDDEVAVRELRATKKIRGLSLLPMRVRRKLTRRQRVRSAVMARDRSLCRYCRKDATTLDHVVPRCKSGRFSMKNCVACCMPCNKRKGSLTVEEAGMQLLPVPKSEAA